MNIETVRGDVPAASERVGRKELRGRDHSSIEQPPLVRPQQPWPTAAERACELRPTRVQSYDTVVHYDGRHSQSDSG